MSGYTDAIKEAFATANSKVAILETIEVSHPAIPSGSLYLVKDWQDLTFTLETGIQQLFTAAGFEIQMPARSEQGIQDLTILIDNTDLQVSDFIKETLNFPNEPVTIKYRPYMSNDLTTPQMDPPLVLYLSGARISAKSVSATATFADIINKTFPNELYTKERFPAL